MHDFGRVMKSIVSIKVIHAMNSCRTCASKGFRLPGWLLRCEGVAFQALCHNLLSRPMKSKLATIAPERSAPARAFYHPGLAQLAGLLASAGPDSIPLID